MADISKLARVIAGAVKNVDLSQNALLVDSLKVGAVSPTELTKAILDRLVALQNGSDVDATYHTHDGRYFTESELGSSGASSGSDLIGDDNTYSNFTPAAATVKGALSGIDAALAAAGSNDFSDALFRISDDGDSSKKIAFQASAISAATVRTITMPDANVNLGEVNTSIQQDGSRAFAADQSMGNNKLTNLANGTVSGDAVNYGQLQAVQSLIENFEWQPSVLDVQVDNTLDPGASPTTGDRYLITDAANLHANFGTIAGVADDDIVEYDGADFVVAFSPSAPGPFVSADDEPSLLYYYGGSSWDQKYFEATTASTGLTKVGFDIRLDASAAGAGIGFSAGVLSVNVDDSTIEINSDTLRLKDAGVTAAKLNTNVADQDTITGGAGSALAVQKAPTVVRTLVAGESFAADTSFFVRWAITGETAGRVYKADKDASSSNLYMAFGIAKSVAGVTAGQNIQVTVLGEHVLGANDVAFNAADVGKELFVGTAGAIILGASLTDATNEAAFCAGAVQATDRIWVDYKQLRGIA